MLKKVFFLLVFLGSSLIQAQSITSCQNPEGYAFYHYSGQVSKTNSGFTKDKITGGMVTLPKVGEKQYDILFVDANKQIISAVGDGGKVLLLRSSKNDATFMHSYPGKVIELYTFWIDSDGLPKYDLIQSKGGSSSPIHKASILVGTCGPINFKLID